MEHRYACEVGFAETDAGGRVHFSQYLIYVERAEHDFLRRRGVVVFDEGRVGWPRVRFSCEYEKPLYFGDCFEVVLRIGRVGVSSISWSFRIVAGDEVCASGEMVCVQVDGAGSALNLGDDLRNRLGVGSE